MTPPAEPPGRFSTIKTQIAVARLIDIPEPDHQHQDWDLLVADPTRVSEFVSTYEKASLLADETKFALMEVILASFDDLVREGGRANEVARRIRIILDAEFTLHAYSIYYWCLWNEGYKPDEDRIFSITLFMREVWMENQ